ncbi:DNA and RNA helicase [Paenibacillus sp. LS1]|uniref:DNA and RNA helicase n=1 Tax=Paenibacillus sp. LS1 TaxID=2992120 RepID=UPI00222E72C8|nr:DNA and RNA helicase [Paenibacillus sp. LS1]MCW3791441.1 DNA and RNA helicase [Paenibacillus sp. LS1]
MLVHIVPRFEKGRILRTEMLENLRDFPRTFMDISYGEYSDGIVAGLKVAVGEHDLAISKGIFKQAGRLYMLEEEYSLPYIATGRTSILKMIFLEPTRRPDSTSYHAEIVLEEEGTLGLEEAELGRFKLKPGAVLRSEYQDFTDIATEYNTWSDLHAPYAAVQSPTLRPEIMRYFATEMLKTNSEEAQDLVFSFMCLNSERVSREAIQHYISLKTGTEYNHYSNIQLHKQLSIILDGAGRRKRPNAHWSGARSGRMIVD